MSISCAFENHPSQRIFKQVSSRNDNVGGTLNRNAMRPINERAATMQRMTTRALPAVPTNQFNSESFTITK